MESDTEPSYRFCLPIGGHSIAPLFAAWPRKPHEHCNDTQGPVLAVPFPHTARRILYSVLLLAFLANLVSAATPSLVLQVSSEAAPAGGFVQFKVSASSPALIGSGAISMDPDPTVFGHIANVAVFSATGDALGYANVNAQHVDAHFTSAAVAIGQLPNLPVFVVSVPVLPGVAPGTKATVTVDPSGAPWNNATGAPYSVTANQGTFTAGGTLSVQSVTPGGGVLSAGTILQINGTGFDSTTAVAIDGVSVSTPHFVNPEQLDVTLGVQTELTGRHVSVTNSAGAKIDYFPSLPSAPAGAPGGLTGLPGVQPLVSLIPYTTAVLPDNRIEQPFVSDTLALLNPNLTPVIVILESVEEMDTQSVIYEQSLTIPPSTLYFFDVTTAFPGGFDELWIIASAPIRILEYGENDRPPGPPTIAAAAPSAPVSSPPTIQLPATGGPLNWTWQIGTPVPPAVNLSIGAGLTFSVSVSGSAAPFLTVTPSQGASPSTLAVAPNLASAPAGTYSATITLTPVLPAGLASLTVQPTSIPVTLLVSAGPIISTSSPDCCLFLEFAQNNPDGPSESLTITSNGTPAAFTVTVESCAGGNWLSVSPLRGTTPATLTLSASGVGLNLAPSSAQGNPCAFVIQGPNNTVIEEAALRVVSGGPASPPPGIQATPALVNFQFVAGTSPAPQTVGVSSGGNPVTAIVLTQSGGDWLNAAVTPGALTMSVAPGLTPGTYSATVILSAQGLTSIYVSVNATVLSMASTQTQLSATPATISASGLPGWVQTVFAAVAASGGIPVSFTATASTSDGGGWLSISPAAGTTPETLSVNLTGQQMPPGLYHGSINLVWGNGSLAIPVVFTVAASFGSPPAVAALVDLPW